MNDRNQSGQKLHRVWFFLGLAAVAVMAVPYLLLGEDAVINYHDQLDGELIAYILQARHLFRGTAFQSLWEECRKRPWFRRRRVLCLCSSQADILPP